MTRSWSWLLGAAAALGLLGMLVAAFVLGILSSVSPVTPLKPQTEKSFGAFDPHLHVSLIASQALESATPLGITRPAEGTYHLVQLRLRNSAAGEFQINPSVLKVVVLDSQGREYEPQQLDGIHTEIPITSRLQRPLDGAGSYQETLIFDLPADIEDPQLWVTHRHWLARMIPDHENGFLLKKITFPMD